MKVVVLAGGISTERDVSLISGKMIYQAMKRLGHQAVLLDVFLGMERDDIDHILKVMRIFLQESKRFMRSIPISVR